MRNSIRVICVGWLYFALPFCFSHLLAQNNPVEAQKIRILQSTPIIGQQPAAFVHPMRCDSNGSIYYQVFNSDSPRNWQVIKATEAKGKNRSFSVQDVGLVSFEPTSHYAVERNGVVHQLAFKAPHTILLTTQLKANLSRRLRSRAAFRHRTLQSFLLEKF